MTTLADGVVTVRSVLASATGAPTDCRHAPDKPLSTPFSVAVAWKTCVPFARPRLVLAHEVHHLDQVVA